MRRLAELLSLTTLVAILGSGASGEQSSDWWYTGTWNNGLFLYFIDAASVKRPTAAYGRYTALTYYATPWMRTNPRTDEKQAVAYEKFLGAFDCRDHTVHGQRFLFNTELLVFTAEERDPYEALVSSLADAEYAFVCLGERAGGSHKFLRINEDPVAYSRRQKSR